MIELVYGWTLSPKVDKTLKVKLRILLPYILKYSFFPMEI